MPAPSRARPLGPSRRTVLRHGAVALPFIGSAWPSHAATAALTTQRFELLSGARANLHHFLLAWAAAEGKTWPSFAGTIAERESWQALLAPQDRAVWPDALAAYASTAGRESVFDPGLIAVRDWANGTQPAKAVPAADQHLMSALEAAMPVYQRHWWPAHDQQNRAWVQSAAELLLKTESDMARHLEAAYGGRWPDAPVQVDVVLYPNPLGAYTAGERVTISSLNAGYRMPRSIEMLFHEASHLDAFVAPLERLVDEAFAQFGQKPPETLPHDLIFFTAGTITEIVLNAQGRPGYEQYGQFGVYRRGARWKTQLPLFDQFWRPFLEAGIADASARQRALGAIAARLR